jgi:hypothetical protein
VHHRTFQLSNEPHEEPIERLLLASASAEERIAVREIGEEFHLGPSGGHPDRFHHPGYDRDSVWK